MILVTGGAGLIGSQIIKLLNERGREDIIVVDRLAKSEKWQNLMAVSFKDYVHADEFFNSPFCEIQYEAIFHMGACSSTTEQDMDYLMLNNVEYSKGIFALACDTDATLVYASSAATYGLGEQGHNDDDSLDALKKLRPLNRYGYSKQLFDLWAVDQQMTPARWYGVKFFNVYGPGELHKGDMRSIALKAFEQIEERGEVKLFKSHRDDFKDGEQLRDFIYVKDAAAACLELASHKEAPSGIYNIGTGKARSFKELVESVFSAMGKGPNIEFIPMPERFQKQYQYFTEAKMEKFKKLFPDFTFRGLKEGAEDYIKEIQS